MNEQRMRDLRTAAVTAVGRGWHVFPVQPGAKTPAVPDHRADRCPGTGRCAARHQTWEDLATADPEVVDRAWSGRWAGCNVGAACGPSRLVVVDLDRHGALPADWRALPGVVDGLDVFAQLLEWAGETSLPETYWMVTPSGGWHLYFSAPEDGSPIRNSAGLLGPAVDVRGTGGYVVAAGWVSGRAYEVLDDRSPAPLPEWIARRLRPQPAQDRRHGPVRDSPANLCGLVEVVRNGKPGDRTGPLVWAAHRLAEEIAVGTASTEDGELLVQAAVTAGIRGGERYARGQVAHVLRGCR